MRQQRHHLYSRTKADSGTVAFTNTPRAGGLAVRRAHGVTYGLPSQSKPLTKFRIRHIPPHTPTTHSPIHHTHKQCNARSGDPLAHDDRRRR